MNQLDRKQAIPVLAPARERLLEYDLMRAVARVGSAERPKIGLMSGLPVLGERFNPMTRQSSEPWVLAEELKRDFDVKQVNMTAESIDKDIDVLLLIHPRDIAGAREYALDQFVLRGGKLIAFVDPYAYFDQQPGPDAGHAGHGIQLDAAAPVQGLGRGDGPGQGDRGRGVRLGRRAALHAHRALAQPHRLRRATTW